jgi:hypothetical protein
MVCGWWLAWQAAWRRRQYPFSGRRAVQHRRQRAHPMDHPPSHLVDTVILASLEKESEGE